MKYKPAQLAVLGTIPEDAVFIHSADVCKLLNISNSTLKNLRAERAIPFYKLGGTFLYSKEEIMNHLVSNYSRRIRARTDFPITRRKRTAFRTSK